jgi:hypothetical protein
MILSTLVAAAFAAALGAAMLLVGYRIFLVLLPIFGFFAGFWLGAQAVALIFGTGFLATTTSWVVGFAVGVVGAVLSYLFFKLGIAIVAAGIGAALGSGFMAALGFETGFLVTIVVLICAIAAAVLAVLFRIDKYVIIAITAISGANALLLSLMLLIGKVSVEELPTTGNSIKPILQDSWFWLIVWLVVAVAGFVVQVRYNREYDFTPDRYVEGWG